MCLGWISVLNDDDEEDRTTDDDDFTTVIELKTRCLNCLRWLRFNGCGKSVTECIVCMGIRS